MERKNDKVINIHSHFNHGVLNDTNDSELYVCNLDFLKNEGQRLNIISMAACSFASVLNPDSVFDENNFFYDVCQKDAYFYQWVVIDPRDKKTYEQALEMAKSKKVLGIKIHSVYHKYDIMKYADEIFEFADKHNFVIMMHPDHIEEIAPKMDNYPNAKLIIAHIGSIEHINAIKNSKHGNIYTDTSGIASSKNNIIEYAVKEIGSDKILFGTDTYSAASQLGRIVFANIAEDDKRNILYNNAKKLFPNKY